MIECQPYPPETYARVKGHSISGGVAPNHTAFFVALKVFDHIVSITEPNTWAISFNHFCHSQALPLLLYGGFTQRRAA